MNNLLYIEVVQRTLDLLKNHNTGDDWETRYNNYYDDITKKKKENLIRINSPLFVYTTITGEKSKYPVMQLRYMGQIVGKLIKKSNRYFLSLDKKTNKTNDKAFTDKTKNTVYKITDCGDFDWSKSTQAREFRKFFKEHKINSGIKHNNYKEHTIESGLLTDLSKKTGSTKALKYIQPVKLNRKRFQLSTTLAASNIHKAKSANDLNNNDYIKYSKFHGGGIDILARRKKGKETYLTVIELKDENKNSEPPETVMYQAICYATFLHELIRSKKAKGKEWYNLFLNHKHSNANVPNKLIINCVVAMPDINTQDSDKRLETAHLQILNPFPSPYPEDELRLYFIEVDNANGSVKKYSANL